MRYVIIKPKTREIVGIVRHELPNALIAAGLDPDAVDHGTLAPGLGYIVHEYGLFVPPDEQSYFGICGKLIAGTAVLYGFDEAGETKPLWRSAVPDVRFYLGVNDVEAAIDRGEIERPFMAVNGVKFWQWPHPAPESMKADI